MILAILLILVFAPLVAVGAVGDIKSAYISTNGYILHVKVDSMSTNGQYNFGFTGFASNNIVTKTNKVVLSVNSRGYNDDRTTNINQRTLYGQTRYPFPYPDTNRFDYLDGSDVWLQIALSDFVYSQDSSISLTLLSGLYVHGSSNSSATAGMTVTNLSTNTYQRVIANNSRIDAPFSLCTNSSQRVGVVAFHWSGQQGRPVRGVMFYATNDTSSVAVTQFVTIPSIDRSFGDPVPVIEYLWDVPLATLGSSNHVTVNWQAYPWVGDENSVTSTDDGQVSKFFVNRYSPITFFNDRLSQLHQTWANVDPTNGNDGTGVAAAAASWTTNTAAFRTVRGAAKGITATNNLLWGRNDCSGGIAWLSAGDHPWSGTNFALGNRSDSWFTVTRQPFVPQSAALITTNSSTSSPFQDINDVVRIMDVTIGFSGETAGGSIFDAIDYIWTDNCYLNSGHAATYNFNTNWWFTRCYLNGSKQGMRAPQASAPSCPVLRGCIIQQTNAKQIEASMFIGNLKTNNTTFQLQMGSISTSQVFTIWAYNKIMLSNVVATDSFSIERREQDIGYAGSAFVQNAVEGLADPAANGLMSFGSSATTSNFWNCVIWDNSLIGCKMNWFYNDASPLRPHLYNHVAGTILDDYNIKSDEFAPADGTRIGNHSFLFGVGLANNVFPETANVGAAGTFPFRWGGHGINSFASVGTTPSSYCIFTDRKAYDTAVSVGNGNYRLKSHSPLFLLPGHWVLPFDIEGHARTAMDPPGAYSAGNPKKGAFF